jgi:hypothetical protein
VNIAQARGFMFDASLALLVRNSTGGRRFMVAQ